MSQPKFVPKDGQTDFTNVRYCPVINTIVTKDEKILLVQRSPDMRLYPNYWNGVSGFLDDNRSIEDKVRDEIQEETGIKPDQVISIKKGQVLLQDAPEYGKTWLVVPVLATVDTSEYKLDWEAQGAQWMTPEEAKNLKLLPGFEAVLATFF